MLRGQIDTVLEFAICQPILISIIDTRLPFSGASRSKCNALPCALFLAAVLPACSRATLIFRCSIIFKANFVSIAIETNNERAIVRAFVWPPLTNDQAPAQAKLHL